jgi:HPt (histidine-containing phosphotransfer) domain-containing protein
MTGGDAGQIVVMIDPLLEDIVPFFLEKRRQDIAALETALAAGDLIAARKVGHDLKGTGGSYGFDEISRIGQVIEQAAASGDPTGVASAIRELRDYLDRLVVTYGEVEGEG